jgi:HSP20 family protein
MASTWSAATPPDARGGKSMVRSLVPVTFELGRSASRLGADPFALLHREVNRLFDDVAGGRGAATPCLNVSETAQAIQVEAELPGVPESQVQVELAGDILTIRGEKRAQQSDAHYHIVERTYGTFARSVRLPFAPEPDQVKAAFEHGVLTVTLPKAAPRSRSHRIPVRATPPSGSATADAAAGHPTPETTQRSADQDEAAGHPS